MSILITANDGTITVPVVRSNVAAGAIDPNGAIDLGSAIKNFVASIDQAGSSEPDVTIIANTLSGVPAFVRTGTGVYTVTLTGAWTPTVTVMWTNGVFGDPTTGGVIFTWTRTSANVLTISTFNKVGVAADWAMTNGTIQIQVYP